MSNTKGRRRRFGAVRELAMARGLGYPFGQAFAMNSLAIAASYAGDLADAVQLARQGGQIPGIPRPAARVCGYLLAGFLAEAGDLAAWAPTSPSVPWCA
jgi:hypothetical protein